ncbi:MAG: fluoride efflux transporter CrcB [Euryarchaeota archaeon]|nr:fluoride efflux transporter CrcB [Euryarchaeota archaeon]RAH12706.1 MAG: fluoride efflux transporter CrcB [Euryarchaeota archaeon]DAC39356.1 MAG TPA: fluoride efflux transporter CrcB [Candidatus Poseidoniales archaeon]
MIELPRQEVFVNSYIAVALGGAIGATLRFAVSEWVGNPQGTLIVNAVGSLLLGICMAALATEMISKELTLFIGTGILGAFTTMSTFSVETIEMWNDDSSKAIGYVLLTMILCPLLALAGWKAFEATA